MDIAMAEDTSQLNIAAVTQLEDLSEVTPTAEDTQLEDLSEVPPTVEDLPQLDIAASSPLRQLPDTESDLNVASIPVDDFDNRPSKKSKNSESIALDDRLKSPTISTSSLVYESSDEPLPPSPTKLMLSPVSELMNQETVLADDDKNLDEPKHITITNNVIYDYLPQDYTLTELDEIAHVIILESKERDILVKIDDISIEQRYLLCLLDKSKWLDDEIISAYICCLKEQALVQNHNDAKIYFENPFVTGLLKQDGQSGRSEPTCMTKVVKNYLNYDMVTSISLIFKFYVS